jgi:hypothetical protein
MSTPPKPTLSDQQRQGLMFTVGSSTRFGRLCEHAQELAALYEELVQPVRTQPTEITVNQVLLLLQDQFFVFDEKTKGHKHPTKRGKDKFTCLLDVYRSYFYELRRLRWKVNPPLVREPPAPRSQDFGITLGEIMGEVG